MNLNDFHFLIENAIKAPSGHNTQPWLFENIENGIVIYPDFNRALTVVDPCNRELYISLGCALENIIIASFKKNYLSSVIYPQNNQDSITILFKKLNDGEDEYSDLFNQISKRQVNRQKYSDQTVSKEILAEIIKSHIDEISILCYDGKEKIKELIPFILKANRIQFENNEFKRELICWMRFNKKEAVTKGDGIWSATMGLPDMFNFVGNFIFKYLVNSNSEEKRLLNLLKHTQGLLIFTSKQDDAKSWIKLGQVFQRFSLKATFYHIAHSHLNMPCEIISVREELREKIIPKNVYPSLIIRYGIAKPMPFSFRRNLNDIIKV